MKVNDRVLLHGKEVTIVELGPILSKVQNGSDPFSAFTRDLKEFVEKKPRLTPAQKGRLYVDEIRKNPTVWEMAGYLANTLKSEARFTASAPAHLQKDVLSMGADNNVDMEIGKTLTGKENWVDENGKVRGAQGPSFCVVANNLKNGDKFESLTGIKLTPYQEEGSTVFSAKKVSIQKWQFVFFFLLSDLQLKLSACDVPTVNQNIIQIREKVPVKFLPFFDAGVAQGLRVAEVV